MKHDDQTISSVSAKAHEVFLNSLEFKGRDKQLAFAENACQGDGALMRSVNKLFDSMNELGDFLEDNSHLRISAKDLLDTLSNLPDLRDDEDFA